MTSVLSSQASAAVEELTQEHPRRERGSRERDRWPYSVGGRTYPRLMSPSHVEAAEKEVVAIYLDIDDTFAPKDVWMRPMFRSDEDFAYFESVIDRHPIRDDGATRIHQVFWQMVDEGILDHLDGTELRNIGRRMEAFDGAHATLERLVDEIRERGAEPLIIVATCGIAEVAEGLFSGARFPRLRQPCEIRITGQRVTHALRQPGQHVTAHDGAVVNTVAPGALLDHGNRWEAFTRYGKELIAKMIHRAVDAVHHTSNNRRLRVVSLWDGETDLPCAKALKDHDVRHVNIQVVRTDSLANPNDPAQVAAHLDAKALGGVEAKVIATDWRPDGAVQDAAFSALDSFGLQRPAGQIEPARSAPVRTVEPVAPAA